MCRKMRNFVPIFEFKRYHSSDEEDFLIIRALYDVHKHDGARQHPAMDTGFMQPKQGPD